MTMLYINGDGHSSAAYANSNFCFANDDFRYSYRARQPHPDNLPVSYGSVLGDIVKARVFCEAEGRCSNARIVRTTKKWLETPQKEDTIIVIGWTNWDREEWEFDGQRYQVGTTGDDPLPLNVKEQYREWVMSAPSRVEEDQQKNHDMIWDFHQELNERGFKHLFFNSTSAYDRVKEQRDWGGIFLDPYSVDKTYASVLESKGLSKFGGTQYYRSDGHFAWAHYLLPHIVRLF